MEARYLQAELETALARKVFLDSDDLTDLRLLKGAVAQSDVLILIQSTHVLERPWCLIELVTAIEMRIPIIAVSLNTGAFPYRFHEASAPSYPQPWAPRAYLKPAAHEPSPAAAQQSPSGSPFSRQAPADAGPA